MEVQGVSCDFTAEHSLGEVGKLFVVRVKTDRKNEKENCGNQQNFKNESAFVFKHMSTYMETTFLNSMPTG